MGEGVLEHVRELGEERLLVDQLEGLQIPQKVLRAVADIAHPVEEAPGELTPDYGRELQGLLRRVGQAVDARDLYVSLDTNHASRWATEIRLGPQDAEILSMLNIGRPGTIRAEKIMAGLYGRGDWPENPRNVLRVKISRIRRMVGSLGVGIEGHYDRGYRLTLSEEPISYETDR